METQNNTDNINSHNIEKVKYLLLMKQQGRLESFIANQTPDFLNGIRKLLSENLNKNDELDNQQISEIIALIETSLSERNDKLHTDDNSIVNKLIAELFDTDIIFFHDEYKDGYAAINGNGSEVLKLRSRAFKQWLSHFVWEKLRKSITPTTTNTVIQTLEGRALFEGKLFPLAIRITFYEGSVYYDLSNGKFVEIDSNGWRIIEDPPILFRSFSHQCVQTIPLEGGSPQTLLNFVNVAKEDERLLLLIYTIACFIPNFPHPILTFYGPQGAGKTTPQKIIKSLIDPSALKTFTASENIREFVQLAARHFFFFFDNLSLLPDWLSDALARACTGDGFSKRELYSDDDDVIYSFQRTIGLNGINLVIQKADLLDRSILIGLERISKNNRREEKEFWDTFEAEKPKILGAIFSTISKAIKIYPTIQLSEYPRLADFTRWGCAIAEALGFSKDTFINAYYDNINKQNDEAIEASPIGTTLLAFMENKEAWEGTPSELLNALESFATNLRINITNREWPKSASILSRKIQLIHTNLSEEGIVVVRDEHARPRNISIKNIKKNADGADATINNSKNEYEMATTTQNKSQAVVDNSEAIPQIEISTLSTPTTPTAFSLYPNISTLTELELIEKEKLARQELQLHKQNPAEHKKFYLDWFTLREEGEKRGLWGFIPSPKE